MIVGKGLIASAFLEAGFQSDQHVIFASGVSNSNETNTEAFAREWDLIQHHLGENTTFVYFSTTSIFDPTKQNLPYIRHKKEIEHWILRHARSYLLVRLPIMVGRSENPHTLINYIVSAIIAQRPVSIHALACRHILDIDDLVYLLMPYLSNHSLNIKINILGSEQLPVPKLVMGLEQVLGKRGQFTWIQEGACYDVPGHEGECIMVPQEDYMERVFTKYFGNQP
jgi:nucleoside-diphosphate-sugar epimerase